MFFFYFFYFLIWLASFFVAYFSRSKAGSVACRARGCRVYVYALKRAYMYNWRWAGPHSSIWFACLAYRKAHSA